jgi:hypothetical protein
MFLQWISGSKLLPAAVSSAISREKWFPAEGAPKGVAVVTHGMNMQPACMDSLATFLAGKGWEVFRPAFAGHIPGQGDYLCVTAAEWEADARRIHAEAASRAVSLNGPLHLVAYSFSSLVFQTMAGELPFKKRIYLAPPFATKSWYQLVRAFASRFPDFRLRSRNTYGAANPETSGRAVLALEDFLARWREGKGMGEKGEALLLAEPEDELVSFRGLKAVVARHPEWRLEPVSNRGHTLGKSYHHLIVDGPSLGEREWARVRGLIRDFLR